MPSTTLRFLVALSVAGVLTGCGTTAVIKPVADENVAPLARPEKAKPIQFRKVVVKLKRGEHIGAVTMGLLCVPQPGSDITWKGGRVSIDSEELTETFKEELQKHNFPTVGDPNALFEDPSAWKTEIMVAGLVTEMKLNVCYPMAGFGNFNSAKGESYLKVEWQIYSRLDRSVVHTFKTEGSFKAKESDPKGGDNAVLNAFAQATRNMLADSKFREIVSRGGETIRQTESVIGERVALIAGKSKPLNASREDWQNAVMTVYGGAGGHGSGFAISENLILTNHHVVGESETVRVRMSSGLEVSGKVVSKNSGRDVALVRVDANLPRHFKRTGERIKVGADVYAIGTPLDEQLSATMSKGVVSSFREEGGKTYIQSDVNVLPGNSGGPLIASSGEVAGITVMGRFSNGAPMGINFFIPIEDAFKTLGVEGL